MRYFYEYKCTDLVLDTNGRFYAASISNNRMNNGGIKREY